MFKTHNSQLTTHNSRGFTLIEIITVLIIIGILTGLALPQYIQFMEKTRGAEARGAIADIKKLVMSEYSRGATTVDAAAVITPLGIATTCPAPASATHFFQYSIPSGAFPTITIRADRCTGLTGKQPGGTLGNFIQVLYNAASGVETPSQVGPY